MKISRTWFNSLILVLMAVAVLSWGINKPFYGHHDWNGVQYGNIARNFVYYRFDQTKFGQLENSGKITDGYAYNTHHPSLMPLLIALSFKIFGISEWSARLVPICFSILMILGLFFLSKLIFKEIFAFWACLTIMMTPMFIYFAKMPVHEPLILAWSVWSIFSYTAYLKTRKRKYFTLLLIFTLLNGLTGWPGYFLYPLISLHSFLFAKKIFKKTLWLWLILVATFLLHLFQTFLLTGSISGGGLVEIFLMRLNAGQDQVEKILAGFSWPKYLIQETRWLTVYFTRVFAVSGLILAILLFAKAFKKKKLDFKQSLLLLALGFAFSYPLIFANAVFIHDYLNIYFLPFLTLSLAFWLEKIFIKIPHKSITIFLLVLLTIYTFRERLDFLKALQASSMHKIGYDLGLKIKKKIRFDQAVIIAAPQFAAHHSKFAYFYADRKIDFWEDDKTAFEKQKNNLAKDYQYLVTIDSLPVADNLAEEFAKLKAEKSGEITFYHL